MSQKLFLFGLIVFLLGFGLVFAGTLGRGSASAGGVVFIGPFPIAFGSGPSGWDLALGSILVGAVMMALLLIWGMRFRAMEES